MCKNKIRPEYQELILSILTLCDVSKLEDDLYDEFGHSDLVDMSATPLLEKARDLKAEAERIVAEAADKCLNSAPLEDEEIAGIMLLVIKMAEHISTEMNVVLDRELARVFQCMPE